MCVCYPTISHLFVINFTVVVSVLLLSAMNWLFWFCWIWQYSLTDLFLVHICSAVLDRFHTHTFNGPFSGNTQVSWYQKGKTNLDFTEARDSEWQWHQLGKSAPRSRQITMQHPTTQFFTGRVPFLLPNQQCQSTEGKALKAKWIKGFR